MLGNYTDTDTTKNWLSRFRLSLDKAIIGWIITLVFCVGFVNAVNMADGANGLIPGIVTVSLTIFYMEVGSATYAIFLTTCGLFTIFNVISGRLFLGDAVPMALARWSL